MLILLTHCIVYPVVPLDNIVDNHQNIKCGLLDSFATAVVRFLSRRSFVSLTLVDCITFKSSVYRRLIKLTTR